MVQGLADPEIRWRIDLGLALPYIRYRRHRRPLAEPHTQLCDRLRAAAGQYFHATVVEVDSVARETQPERFPPGAVAEPDALYASADAEATRY